jgi:hypothetical protein
VDRGKIIVLPVQKKFLEYRNKLKQVPVKLRRTSNRPANKGWKNTVEDTVDKI